MDTLCFDELRILYSSFHESMTDLYSSLEAVISCETEQSFSQVMSGLVGLLQDLHLLAYIVFVREFEHSGHTENLLAIWHHEIEHWYFMTLFKSHQKAAFAALFLCESRSSVINAFESSDGFLVKRDTFTSSCRKKQLIPLFIHSSCADDAIAITFLSYFRIDRIIVVICTYGNICLPDRSVCLVVRISLSHFLAFDFFKLSVAWGEDLSFTFF